MFLTPIFPQDGSDISKNDLLEVNYFDFWIGLWEVSWEQQDGSIGKGINRIEKILDGNAIQEHFEILEGQAKGFKGTSISVYHKAKNKWKQFWVDKNDGFFEFTGMLDGNIRIFQTETEQTNGKELVRRMVFYDITEDSFIWDWELSEDNGRTWQLMWRINYRRIDE